SAKENPFPVYGAKQTRAFCYISDAVAATYRIAVLPGGKDYIVNIGNPEEEIAIGELCQRLFQIAGYKAALDLREPPPGSPERRCPDISRLSTLLGPLSFVSLTDGLTRTYDWYSRYLAEAKR